MTPSLNANGGNMTPGAHRGFSYGQLQSSYGQVTPGRRALDANMPIGQNTGPAVLAVPATPAQTFKAARLEPRPAVLAPSQGPMAHEELTAGFYNLLAQIEREQAHVDSVEGVLNMHAQSLDEAEIVVRKIMNDHETDKVQHKAELEVDVDILYRRILGERDEALQHVVAGIHVDSR